MTTKKPYEERMKELEIIDDNDLYSLRDSVAHFLAPRLRLMQENTCTYPPELTPDQWSTILGQMAEAFELVIQWDSIELDPRMANESEAKIKYGLLLFSEWFFHLWD